MQCQFDWDRAEQLGMVESWACPRVPGVSASAIKHVLRAIDSYGRGREAWPSETTLARDTGLGLRTVKRAIRALHDLSLLVVERRGPKTVNHYRIVWNELALRCGERYAKADSPERGATGIERSATTAERSATVTERSAMVALHEVPPWPLKRHRNEKETTTTAGDVVVVLLRMVMAKADEAVRLARARGVTDEEIRERYQQWRELPEPKRLPGTLYNWLALEGSYRPASAVGKPVEVISGRGDGLTREQVAREALRVRIVRAGRAAGVTQEAIEQRLSEAGV